MATTTGNIVKCPECKKTFVNEEFEGHYCNPEGKMVEIDVARWVTIRLPDKTMFIITDRVGNEFVFRLSLDKRKEA